MIDFSAPAMTEFWVKKRIKALQAANSALLKKETLHSNSLEPPEQESFTVEIWRWAVVQMKISVAKKINALHSRQCASKQITSKLLIRRKAVFIR